MRAMLLEAPKRALKLVNLPTPTPGKGQVLIKVAACGVCRTDLHLVDGELPHPHLPIIPGHEIVGRIEKLGEGVNQHHVGDRVGVGWLSKSCSHCFYCKDALENLCDTPLFTGYQKNGGYAEYCVAEEAFVFSIPKRYSDVEAAPLLCAGLASYRSLKMVEGAKKIGFYGFGAAAHLLTQIAKHEGQQIFAFTRPGDKEAQQLALSVGAKWAGSSEEKSPELLDAAIIFAPVGKLVPTALKAVRKAGVVVCAGIHMSDIPSFPYALLWEERVLRSVANVTRSDGREFLALAEKIPLKIQTTTYPLEKANQALDDLRSGKVNGAAVLTLL